MEIWWKIHWELRFETTPATSKSIVAIFNVHISWIYLSRWKMIQTRYCANGKKLLFKMTFHFFFLLSLLCTSFGETPRIIMHTCKLHGKWCALGNTFMCVWMQLKCVWMGVCTSVLCSASSRPDRWKQELLFCFACARKNCISAQKPAKTNAHIFFLICVEYLQIP